LIEFFIFTLNTYKHFSTEAAFHGTTSLQIGDLAVIMIYSYTTPKTKEVLPILDMLFIDDLGWCTSQVFLRLDFMFRTMTESDKLFGGVLVIVNMNPLQPQLISFIPAVLPVLTWYPHLL
jgi:hypothetical protein